MSQKRIVHQVIETVYELNQSQSKEVVAQILFGSKRKKITQNKLNHCLTYGNFLSEPIDYNETVTLISRMIKKGILIENRISNYHFVVVSLTGASLFVTNDEISSYKLFNHTSPNKTKSHQALQILRKKLAYEADLSPFIIFNNYVLEEIERQQPKTKEDFLSIKGLGNASWQLFGEDVCQLFQ